MIKYIVRFWHELKNPALKCERTHHVGRKEYRRGYRKPEGFAFRTVAYSVSQSRFACKRCGEELSPWEDSRCDSVQSLTMDGDDMDKLNQNGEIWFNTQS